MASTPLTVARREAEKQRRATQRRDEAIRSALAAGHSLREVAEAAGLSASGVRKIANRETDR